MAEFVEIDDVGGPSEEVCCALGRLRRRQTPPGLGLGLDVGNERFGGGPRPFLREVLSGVNAPPPPLSMGLGSA